MNYNVLSKIYMWVVTAVAVIATYTVFSLANRMTHMVLPDSVVWVRHDSDKNVQPVPEVLKNVHTIVCFGDSITRGKPDGGYVGVVQKYISSVLPEQKIEIVNAGVDGDTTRNLIKRIDNDVFTHNPQLITLLVGVNDVAKGYAHLNRAGDGPLGVPLNEYTANIKSIISQAKEHNAKIILISPGLIIENIDHPGNQKLVEYVSALEKTAKETGVQFIDVHRTFSDLDDLYHKETGAYDCLLTRDGTHPNPGGAKVIANCVLNELGITTNSRAAVQKDSPY